MACTELGFKILNWKVFKLYVEHEEESEICNSDAYNVDT
jgi:hypothetical protein